MSINLYRGDLDKILDDAGTENYRDDYSGRGMYGKTCFGITGGLSDYVEFLLQASMVLGLDEAREMFGAPSYDSMGWDTIYYFPNVKIREDDSFEIYDEEQYTVRVNVMT